MNATLARSVKCILRFSIFLTTLGRKKGHGDNAVTVMLLNGGNDWTLCPNKPPKGHSCIPGLTTGVSQQVLTKSLHDYLFADYNTNLIPICNEGENVTVKIDLALRQIMDVDEPRQTLKANVWIRLTWNDCRLKWNTSLFGNLTDITVLYKDIWFPDITLVDSAAEEVMFPGQEFFSAQITNSGLISYNFPTIITSICRVNVRYFPFDSQRCALSFASWSYHGFHLDVENKNPNGDLDAFVENSEWDIEEIPVIRKVSYYSCCVEPYPDVTFYVVLQRRPVFYVLTMLFPCILVSFVSALVFILPTESGEKISLDITVLLSLAVFLLVVSEALPPASDNFPIIGYYFATSMALVSVSLLQTILILNVFYRGTNGRRVPRWLQSLCFRYFARVVFVKPHSPENKEHVHLTKEKRDTECFPKGTYTDLRCQSTTRAETGKIDDRHVIQNGGKSSDIGRNALSKSLQNNLEDPTTKVLQDLDTKLNYVTTTVSQQSHEDDINSEWRDVANILDRVFLLFYCLVTIVTTLVFGLQFL